MSSIRKHRKMRSGKVRLVLVGAAAFSLGACREEQVETSVFPSVDACMAQAEQSATWYTPTDCQTSFAEAEQVHRETAPRYDEQALCEEQHGGPCQAETRAGGGSIFMPLMMGYMMGNMMSSGNRAALAQPLYRTSAGNYTTAGGTTTFRSNNGNATLRASNFQRPAATVHAPPMSRATVARSGGFGGSRASGGSVGG